jgi:dienelactone hydrolase
MTSTRTKLAAALAAAALSTAAAAKVQTKQITYRQGDTPLVGYLAWDDAAHGKRPGVLIVHEWWGMNDHARAQARRVAEAGYVGFALDMYGEGKVTTHPKDAMAFAQQASKEPAVMKARFDAARAVLAAQPQVDATRISAFGYCFGGGVALNMARAGEDLAAVVTFHGALKPWTPAPAPGSIKPAILIQAGGSDPMVPASAVQAVEKELKDAGARVNVIVYPEAKHAFTNPDAGKAGMDGLAYDAKADRESWAAAVAFLKQVLGK